MNTLNVIETPDLMKPNEISFRKRQADLAVKKEQEDERKKREDKVFSSYFQLNKKTLPLLDLCITEKPKAFRLFIFLINHMDKYNCVVCCRSAFEKALGLSRSTTYEHLKYLQDLNFIYTGPVDKNTRYVINPNIIWHSKKRNLKYCPFPKEKALLNFPNSSDNTYKKNGILYVKSKQF